MLVSPLLADGRADRPTHLILTRNIIHFKYKGLGEPSELLKARAIRVEAMPHIATVVHEAARYDEREAAKKRLKLESIYMEQFFAEHFDAIVTLIVGLLGGGALVKYTSKKDTNESNKYEGIDTGGGDFAGRDMHKNV